MAQPVAFRIKCMTCNTFVEKFYAKWDDDDNYEFTPMCHGKKQTIKVHFNRDDNGKYPSDNIVIEAFHWGMDKSNNEKH